MSAISAYKTIFRRLFHPLPPSPILPIAFSLFLSFNAFSQTTNCLQRLSDAESLFQTGIFEDIPDILEECLDTYQPPEKLKAMKLIVLSRYMNDDVNGSEETMHLLLKEFPLFKPDAGDPVDFQYVYNTFQVQRLVDAGIFLGSETAWGIITEPWSPFTDEFNYAPGFPGYSLGAQINYHLTKNLVLNSQPALSSYKFRIHHDSPINGILDLKQQEQQTIIELPINIQAEFLKSRIKPYVKLGGTIGFLMSSNTKSTIERYDPVNGGTIFTSREIINDHKEFRKNMVFLAGGGIGLNVDFNKYRFFSELNYHQSFSGILKKGANRYDQVNLWTEGWFDSDFRINKVSLRFGFVKSFYWIRKKKQVI
jgi:hypothetical protein